MAKEAKHTPGPIEKQLRTAAKLQRERREITWEFGRDLVDMCAEHGDAIADAVAMAGDPVRAAAPDLLRAGEASASEMGRVAAELGKRGLIDLADDLRLQAQEMRAALSKIGG